jgi:hypothetical protein
MMPGKNQPTQAEAECNDFIQQKKSSKKLCLPLLLHILINKPEYFYCTK